ncbi:TIGR00297 family protein [Hydrococcus rivularis NIES-593]|uniref:TIGR00297 family protein n=1 Tax=Hydrococcus rivularis NIES-593 TaxID=1921803 RepID=A0A1U7HT54_9CYAN|nr:TIGR00297 family protein [Hydrococcus rivularis]OKH26762.1 TIGR00297 family protein [Hydrococcus rivularis NIES-593]
MFSTIEFSNPWLVAVGLNTVLLAIAFLAPKKLLTPAGYLNAWFLGVLIWGTLGWQGYAIVMFYFLVGSGLTYVGMAQKEAEGIAEERSGTRGPGNLWSSALTGTICAVASLFVDTPIRELLLLGYVASFATKLSDTTATEIGKAYGRRTFLITTLQPVARGTEGAISLEGTISGIVASGAIATLSWGIGLIDPIGIALCVVAAFVATSVESLIGATIESKLSWLTHDVVNFLNTLIGAIVAILTASIFLINLQTN